MAEARERTIDYFELWQEKMFLGEEFLTWLWLCSEIDSGFAADGGPKVEIWFENSLKLQSGQGPSKRSVTCQNAGKENGTEWPEAFTAVMKNKKVMNGRLRIKSEEREWSLALPADTLCPKSAKLMAGAEFKDDEDGKLSKVGALLDRVVYYTELTGTIEALLSMFLKLRLSPEWASEELPRLRAWVARWTREEG